MIIIVFLIQIIVYGIGTSLGYFLGVRKNLVGKTDVNGSFIIGLIGGISMAIGNTTSAYLEVFSPKDSIIPVVAPFAFLIMGIVAIYLFAGYCAKKIGADIVTAKKISEISMSYTILTLLLVYIATFFL